MKISFTPIWFDSLGAKSSSTLVQTPDISILIDPGVAIMQPSFPAPWLKKIYWVEVGRRAIRKASKRASVIVISHYHYDHYLPMDLKIYKSKIVLAKDPNEYINDSQRERAEQFYGLICKRFRRVELGELMERRKRKRYPDPMKALPLARKKSFGDYDKRRRELLRLGKRWFENRVRNWSKRKRIPELEFKEIRVIYADLREFEFGKTKLKFTKPLFHGIEFSRVGWVFATVVEYRKEKLVHSSDLSGVYIEDYAELLIKENPQVLILDGPPTYMFGFMLNQTNLQRCIANTCRIIKKCTNLKLLIYDHHLLREKRYRERTKEVWNCAKKKGVKILAASELLGKRPVIDVLWDIL
jgi:hypothetical protein